jgi:hypothetical protein
MSTTTFETAEVGDKVYSTVLGWGVIESIKLHDHYPVHVSFYNTNGEVEIFTYEGYFYDHIHIQSLFWDEVVIKAPKKPAGVKVINGIEVPDISFKPEHGEQYYIPLPTSTCAHLSSIFYSCEEDYYRRNNNLCYPFTEEGKQAAILHAKAMLN